MKVLLSAYACEPGKGSEPEVGWQLATGIARRGHDVWVITRANNRPGIERELAERPVPNLHFAYFDLPPWGLRLKRWLGVNAYYRLWQSAALPLARTLHEAIGFDRGQHVTFVSVRHPSFLRHLGIPYIFGPVAGGEHAPSAMLHGFPWLFRVKEATRMLLTRVGMLAPSVQQTLRLATRVLVTSPQTLALLPASIGARAEVRLAISAPPPLAHPLPPREGTRQPLRILFVGRSQELKGIDLALVALATLRDDGSSATLTLVSEGPDRPRLEARIAELGLNGFARFQPFVPRAELAAIYAAHDVLLFPSLRDSGGMVVLEAMQHGLPVICLALGGPGQIVTDACGLAASADDPDCAVAEMAGALRKMERHVDHYAACSSAAIRRVENFSIERLLDALGY